MSTLYQINEQIEQYFEDNINQETGEILNTELLEKLEVEKKEKTFSIVKYIQHLENNEVAIKEEEKRLKTLKTVNAKRIDSLKKYLKSSMEIDKIEKIDFGTLKLSIAKNPPKLILDKDYEYNMNDIIRKYEEQFKEAKSDVSKMKKDIKQELKDGKEVPGAKLEYSTSLRIK